MRDTDWTKIHVYALGLTRNIFPSGSDTNYFTVSFYRFLFVDVLTTESLRLLSTYRSRYARTSIPKGFHLNLPYIPANFSCCDCIFNWLHLLFSPLSYIFQFVRWTSSPKFQILWFFKIYDFLELHRFHR